MNDQQMTRAEFRKSVRKKGIAARDSYTKEERVELSKQMVERLVSSPEFSEAKTIMIYKATRGEARLEAVESAPESIGKRLCYPLCISDTEMIALLPESEESWVSGAYGIMEPVKEKSLVIEPEEIDLVVCPCTVFDENCNRMGMGAGYYDRFLQRCTNAHIVSVAFDSQKADAVPTDPWDKPMEKTFTDKAVYVAKK